MSTTIIPLYLSISVMITPCCVIYSSNKFKGTVPFDREIKEYVPVKDNWFLSMDAIRSFIHKTQSVDKTDYPVSEQYGRDNLIPFLNYIDVQNYIKRLRKYL